MSIIRSPPTATGGGSQPDLSKICGEIPSSQITFRKRKQPDDKECQCSEEIKLVRSELSRITTLLETYVGSNTLMMDQMRECIGTVKTEITDLKASHEEIKIIFNNNIADISSQMQDIKSATTKMSLEHVHIKTQLTQLETKINNGEKKIDLLETDLNKLKISPASETQNKQICTNEQIIREVQERKKRENNIIIMGIAENDSSNIQERHIQDENQVLQIISQIITNIPKPAKIFRIGKYSPGKSRKIKVCFDKPDTALLLLKSREKLPSNIKIFSDQTPAQLKYYLHIKEVLNHRIANGETDIKIKYVNGTPTIIKTLPKNSNQQL